MKTITKTIDERPGLFNHIPNTNIDKTILLDIETLGFMAKYQPIYMIGFIYLDNDQYVFVQYMAETPEDEYELLYKTVQLLRNFDIILHYNGISFDMPYIMTRLAHFKIPHTIDRMTEIDLYVDLKPFKKYLPLENLKLKTVEDYFGMDRTDPFTGGQLIATYKEYLESPDEVRANQLLLHNEEDLIGLLLCLQAYELVNYLNNLKTLEILPEYQLFMNKDYLFMDLDLKSSFEMKLNLPHFQLFINKHQLTISVPILTGDLKLFFPDYENYYYLTEEETVVHKSIGKLVDHQFRKKAKKSNCFVIKNGRFIPLLHKEFTGTRYQKDFNSKPSYIEIADQFLSETDQLTIYILSLLHQI